MTDPGEEQRAIIHDDDVLGLVGLEQPLVLGPCDVLQWRVGLDVALHNTRQSERQVLDRRRERHFRRVCAKPPSLSYISSNIFYVTHTIESKSVPGYGIILSKLWFKLH